MIIGITGRIAAGKEVFVDYLKHRGFIHYNLSDILREELIKNNIEITRKNLQDCGDKLRKEEGGGVLIKRLNYKLNRNNNYVITGIRNPGEVLELRKQKDFVLIAINAPREQRFQRITKRAKPSDPKTWEEFLIVDDRDYCDKNDILGQQVGACIEMADFDVMNDSDIYSFKDKLKEIYKKISKL